MCGVFAYAGPGAALARLRHVALRAGARGPYAFGFAWQTGDGAWHTHKQPGSLLDHPDALGRLEGARLVLGQARLATSGGLGGHADPANNPPLLRDGAAIAHNGSVYNHAAIGAQCTRAPETTTDSEALLLALLDALDRGDPLPAALDAALAQAAPSPAVVLAARPGELAAARRGRLRLYAAGDATEGFYLANRRFAGAALQPDPALLGFRAQGGRWDAVPTAGKETR